MTDVFQPAQIDANGDIVANGRGGLSLVLTFQDADGLARDVSANALYFEVEGKIRQALGAGATTDKRTIALTRSQVASIADQRRTF